MTVGKVFRQGWTPDDIPWTDFDAAAAEPWLVAAVKTAALVEYNAPDYVAYLKQVFPEPEMAPVLEQWGREETQHGRVLGRWAELADPSFKLAQAAARFRAGYKPAHFKDAAGSVRGSRRGEMIARCVVESGTSTYYTAVKEAAAEPVLQEIAGRIAADEFRHYRLFYDTHKAQPEAALPFWKRLLIAAGRVTESGDDEIAYAYYCANLPASQPYDRAACARVLFGYSLRIYRRRHIERLIQMTAKAVGAAPHGVLARLASALLWRMLRLRAGFTRASA
jgi:hypothetical protein